MNADSDERRLHRRHELKCPITLFGRGGQVLVKACTANLSRGGVYLPVPQDVVEHLAPNVNVAFSIQDASAADHQMEGFAANAEVVRQESTDDGVYVGVALQFDRPMYLPIET